MVTPEKGGDAGPPPPLVVGTRLRCPYCEALGDPAYHFRTIESAPRYRSELNVIFVHIKKRGGCGHMFSPRDVWVIQAYLAGDLVPTSLLAAAQRELSELRDKKNGNSIKPTDILYREEVSGGR
jgi:hypothetical protein